MFAAKDDQPLRALIIFKPVQAAVYAHFCKAALRQQGRQFNGRIGPDGYAVSARCVPRIAIQRVSTRLQFWVTRFSERSSIPSSRSSQSVA